TSPRSKLFALDAATGEKKWLFDPESITPAPGETEMSFYNIIRGVIYWKDDQTGEERIFYGTGNRVYAVDAKNGQLISDFGKYGYIDLTEGLDARIAKKV